MSTQELYKSKQPHLTSVTGVGGLITFLRISYCVVLVIITVEMIITVIPGYVISIISSYNIFQFSSYRTLLWCQFFMINMIIHLPIV